MDYADSVYLINKAIDSFDFNKAHALFTLMGWTYWGNKRTPTVDELKFMVKKLAIDSITAAENSGNPEWHSCGRFTVSYYPDERQLDIQLIFSEGFATLGDE